MLALAFAFGPVAQAEPRLDGGPARLRTNDAPSPNGGPTGLPARSNAEITNNVRADLGMPNNILPPVRISFAPVGLTFDQTARLNLVNMDVANGITVRCSFIDASGNTLAQSVTTLSIGKTTSVDYRRQSSLLNEAPEQLRAEVRVQFDILTYETVSESVRRSLEVFDNNSGATTTYMANGL